jgi:hypothetical protein
MTESTLPQLSLLARQIDELKQANVTRQEFDELRQLVQQLAKKIDRMAQASEIPDEHLAIMSAVFAASIGKRFRIRSVKTIAEPSGWTQIGRSDLHAQRHVRRS